MKEIFQLSGKIIMAQLSAIFLTFMVHLLFGVVANKLGITWIITVLIYFGAFYSVGWHKGKSDARKLPGMTEDVKKAVFASGIVCLITLALLVFRICTFHFASGGNIEYKPAVFMVSEILYRLWNFPLVDFMQKGTLVQYALPVIYPLIIVPVAYILGTKRFSFIENVWYKILYKNKKTNKK